MGSQYEVIFGIYSVVNGPREEQMDPEEGIYKVGIDGGYIA